MWQGSFGNFENYKGGMVEGVEDSYGTPPPHSLYLSSDRN